MDHRWSVPAFEDRFQAGFRRQDLVDGLGSDNRHSVTDHQVNIAGQDGEVFAVTGKVAKI